MNRTLVPKSTRRQLGSVVVYTGVTLLAILTSAVIAIEMGRSYNARHQYQKMASLAALDAVGLISGCDTTALPTQAELESRVNASLLRNGSTTEITQRRVETGTVATDEATSQRYLVPGSIANAEAVRVTLTGRFPRGLTSLLPQGDTMRVSATAEQAAVGSFFVGSGVIDVNSRNTLLTGLLGSNVNLSLVNYQNLLNANIPLELLATAVGLTVQDLSDPLALSTQTPILSDVLNDLAGEVSAAGNTAAAGVLATLAAAASHGGNRNVPLDLILGAVDDTAVEAPLINLLDIVTTLAQAANASNSPTASPINLKVEAIPLVGTVTTLLRVVEPPQLGFGRAGEAQASTAQVRLMIRIEASTLLSGLQTSINSLVNGLLSVLGVAGVKTTVSVVPAPLNIGVDVDVAKATAYLDRIQCPRNGVNGGDPIATLSTETAAATVNIGTFTGSASTGPALSPTGSIPLASVAIDATCVGVKIGSLCVGLNLGSTTLTTVLGATAVGVAKTGPTPLPLDVTQFTPVTGLSEHAPPIYKADGVPPAMPVTGNPQTVGSAVSAAVTLALTNSHTGAGLSGTLGGLLNSIVSGISGLVSGLVNVVNGLATSTINPLLQALGVRTGTADVTMQSVTVSRPSVVSTCLPDSSFAPPRGCPGN